MSPGLATLAIDLADVTEADWNLIQRPNLIRSPQCRRWLWLVADATRRQSDLARARTERGVLPQARRGYTVAEGGRAHALVDSKREDSAAATVSRRPFSSCVPIETRAPSAPTGRTATSAAAHAATSATPCSPVTKR